MKKLIFLLVFILIAAGCSNTQNQNVSNNTENQEESNKTEEQNFPTKPIELVVPYSAGGATDQIARAIEKSMSKYLPNKQIIVIKNTPGGASVTGTASVANAEPDGYTLGLIAPGAISIQPHFGNAPYSHEDFEGVIRIAQNPVLFAVGKDTPWQTFDEWVQYVKENPGKFAFGSGGIGNTPQVAMEKFLIANEFEAKYIPFDGSSDAHAALLSGTLEGEVSSPQQFKGQEEDLRILANLGSIKHDFYKEIPTLKELGYGQSTDVYFGIVAPKGTPKEIIAILHDAFKQSLDDPEVIEIIEKNGVTVDYAGSEDFKNQISTEYEDYGETLKRLGLIN
ncbi:tripartite tricarboxylate transporter substrate-binding protein [Bacillus sp. Marseille-P3661]|uniref:tripartite tricarboxylate transporter substrate-binding protein n=1 Tax=Bacillus sp. Marseille-P3661 TaxID=1936234 RepID=UPI000C853272|nr:tripartite tricarboxylate transporter substrate-binding protein [Bacillus sp. Marseille-P3661]